MWCKIALWKKKLQKKVNSLFIFRLQKSPFILLRHLACIQSICCILIENTSYHWFHGKFNRTLLWTYQLHSADQVMSWNKKNKIFRWTLLLSYFFFKSCQTVLDGAAFKKSMKYFEAWFFWSNVLQKKNVQLSAYRIVLIMCCTCLYQYEISESLI